MQLGHRAKLTEIRAFIESTQLLYPEISEEAMSIYTNGASPEYEETPGKAVPDDGYPRDPRNPKKITGSIWGDTIRIKALACVGKSLICAERLECAPTTAPQEVTGPHVQWQVADYIGSTTNKSRAERGWFPPIRLPGIKHIAAG